MIFEHISCFSDVVASVGLARCQAVRMRALINDAEDLQLALDNVGWVCLHLAFEFYIC